MSIRAACAVNELSVISAAAASLISFIRFVLFNEAKMSE
jgi:hypothetical protein